jgi:Tat protein translocase TatB subunit
MFGIGWSEFLIIAVIALLVLGPEKLPELARQLGKWTRELRAMASQLRQEFQQDFDVAAPPATRTPLDSLTRPEDLKEPDDDFGAVIRKEPPPNAG